MKISPISTTFICLILINVIEAITVSNATKLELNNAEETPVLSIKQGSIRGKYWKTRLGRMIRAYVGLRYAKPPIGQLRFKPAVAPDGWKDVYNATKIHAVCPQRNVFVRDGIILGDEDCLFLNVYTPLVAAHSKPLPVMFFIHGGGYLAGSGNLDYYGPDFLLDKDVVLVVPNYRLGALGFLTTGDHAAPGNLGLKDQTMALRWVKENIKYFGGDPNLVTIFGESAGGASVNLHMMSPLSKGLFHRAISQSGTLHCPWAFDSGNRVLQHTKHLATIFNCSTASSKELLSCLSGKNALEIVSKDVEFMKWDYDPFMPFGPVIEPKSDQAFIDVDPRQVDYKINVPWMMGATTGEGALRVASLFSNKTLLQGYNKNFEKLAPMSLLFDGIIKDNKLAVRKLKKFYFSDKPIDENTKIQLVDLYSDGWFVHGIYEAAKQYQRNHNKDLYFYLFGYRGTVSFTRIFGDPARDYGVSHADDLQYLFPVGVELWPDIALNDKDKQMIDILTTLWTNFAKFGNPTPATDSKLPKKWLPVSTNHLEYYKIDKNGNTMTKDLYKQRIQLWKQLYTDKNKTNSKSEFLKYTNKWSHKVRMLCITGCLSTYTN